MPDPVALTEEPVDIVASANLEAGTRYLLQADTAEIGDTPVWLSEAAALPSVPEHKLGHLESITVEPEAGDKVWAWTPVGRRLGQLLISKAI